MLDFSEVVILKAFYFSRILYECVQYLSGMQGNSHISFLGGSGLASVPGYQIRTFLGFREQTPKPTPNSPIMGILYPHFIPRFSGFTLQLF